MDGNEKEKIGFLSKLCADLIIISIAVILVSLSIKCLMWLF